MQIRDLPITSLHLDPNNARKHDDKNLAAIKGSLAKFGQQHPIIIDKNYVVLAGNGRVVAAKDLGWETIKCVETDLESATEKTAFALADNRTAELAGWDDEILNQQLISLQSDDFNIDEIGFDPNDFDLDDGPKEGNINDDEVPETDDNAFGVKRGDVWLLGAYLECDNCNEKFDYDASKADSECPKCSK